MPSKGTPTRRHFIDRDDGGQGTPTEGRAGISVHRFTQGTEDDGTTGTPAGDRAGISFLRKSDSASGSNIGGCFLKIPAGRWDQTYKNYTP